MIFRLLFPYFFLSLIVLGYLYFRHVKLGPVLLKVDRKFFSSYNSDSIFLIIIIAIISFFLARYEIINSLPGDETLILGPFTYIIFYGVLLLVATSREVEKPALREKGISSSRGFWLWQEIESFRWSKSILTINFARGKRKRVEAWQISPMAKKEIDQFLKKMVPKRTGRSKKKG